MKKQNNGLAIKVLALEKELREARESLVRVSLGERVILVERKNGNLTNKVSDLMRDLQASVETREKHETLVYQLEKDLERAREVKVTIVDTSKKVGKMLLGLALGFRER